LKAPDRRTNRISEEETMSDEQRIEEEPEVEGHVKHSMNEEHAEEGEDNDVEAHVRHSNVRMDSPRHI
jgi:hypothetical protein